MDIVSLCGCAVVVSVLVLVLKQQKPEIGLLLTIGAGVMLLALIFGKLAPVLNEIGKITSVTGTAEYIPVVFKALGICLVTQLTADICRDAGQQTIAANVEMAGRIAMVIVAIPLLSTVLSTALGIING